MVDKEEACVQSIVDRCDSQHHLAAISIQSNTCIRNRAKEKKRRTRLWKEEIADHTAQLKSC